METSVNMRYAGINLLGQKGAWFLFQMRDGYGCHIFHTIRLIILVCNLIDVVKLHLLLQIGRAHV